MPNNPFSVPVPDVAQGLLGFQRARKLRQDAATTESNRKIALERLGLLKSGQEQSQANTAANQDFRRSRAERADANADRAFNESVRQFDNKTPGLTFDQKKELASLKGGSGGTKAEKAAALKEKTKLRELSRGALSVQRSVDRLMAKVGDPDSPRQDMKDRASRFESATGPLEGTQIGQAARGMIFGETKGLTLLKKVRQDAQAINSQMQRALLKGGGSITEAERKSVDDILGQITTATSAKEARSLLINFKGIVQDMFNSRLPDGGQVPPPQASRVQIPSNPVATNRADDIRGVPQASELPALPPGFERVQ